MTRCTPILAALVLVLVLASAPTLARAYESDVHYGLTRWLALRAGFTGPQADAIALGDQRIDGGVVETTRLALEYACAGGYPEVARRAQHEHAPSAKPVPAPAAERVVVAGDAPSRVDLVALAAVARGKEGAMLGKLGEALHPLQDSWAHKGVPSTPAPGGGVDCDPSLASGHPLAAGGAAPHAADLTSTVPADALAMAQATYEALIRFGRIDGHARDAAPWESLVEPVVRFDQARSKSGKRAWFVMQGMADTRFLEGISLPDGPDPGPLRWDWRSLPPTPGEASMQHDAPADGRAFFDRLLARWLGGEAEDRVVAELGPSMPDEAAMRNQLTARLRLWRLRDHGAVSALAHLQGHFDAAQLKAVGRLAQPPASRLPAMTTASALLPLQPSTPAPMPMLPYVVKPLPAMSGRPRLLAIARMRHAPYDSIGWIAERRGDRWTLVDMVSTVDP